MILPVHTGILEHADGFRVSRCSPAMTGRGVFVICKKITCDARRIATACDLRQHEQITNSEYRRLNRVDAMMAGQELRGLVEVGLVEQGGVGRWTSYQLKVSPEQPAERKPQTDEEKILEYVRQHGSINNSECCDLLNVESSRAWYLLKKLDAHGLLKRQGEKRWTRYGLPL